MQSRLMEDNHQYRYCSIGIVTIYKNSITMSIADCGGVFLMHPVKAGGHDLPLTG
jgi:hypothetical protein